MEGCKSYTVLDAIATSPQGIVFQVEDLKASMHVFDELADLTRPLVVAHCDRVHRKPCLTPPY